MFVIVELGAGYRAGQMRGVADVSVANRDEVFSQLLSDSGGLLWYHRVLVNADNQG